MKKLFLILALIGYTALGQNFFQSEQEAEGNSQSEIFSEYSPPSAPEQGVDAGPGNAGPPIPLDEGWYFLLGGGVILGFYFLYKEPKRKTV